ncbi:MAG: hypothetical protein KA116_08320 [Proteobacteria bacterium]|nr:hypothetical protein [Pseudomonadota bacterium]
MSRLLIIGDSVKDPVIGSLERLSSLHNFDFSCISPENILKAKSIKVNVEAEDVLQMTLQDNRQISLKSGSKIFSRMTELPESYFSRFSEVDRDYAKREFEAFVSGLVITVSKEARSSSALGYLNGFYGLPLLWERLRSTLSEIQVELPSYVAGGTRPQWDAQETVESNIYDFSRWRVNESLSGANLFIKRPMGRSVVIYSNAMGDFALCDQSHLDSNFEAEKLSEISCRVLSELEIKSAEILLFINENKFVLASVTPLPIASYSSTQQFDKVNEIYLK